MWATVLTVLKVVAIVLGKLGFVVVLPFAVAGTLFGMPGSILVIADATIYSAFHHWQSPPWWVLIVLVAIAIFAELAESLLALAGIRNTGASTSTGVWTIVGGLAGVVAGGALAPVVALLGALAGPVGVAASSVLPPIGLGLVGGFLGGYLYERRRGRTPEEARLTGWGALLGRLSGSVMKGILVGVMAAIVLVTSLPTLF